MKLKSQLVILFVLIFQSFVTHAVFCYTPGTPLEVGIVLSIGGLNDNAFNDAAYSGVQILRESRNCFVEVVEPPTIASIENALRYLASQKKDLIFAIGIFANDPLKKVAKDFPEVRFALLDSVVDEPNVLSILFDEEQGSFYAGAFAALISKSKIIGFLGGMESSVISAFEQGFVNGARFANPDVTILTKYLGKTPEAFYNPTLAFSEGSNLFEKGADTIYHAAGKSGLGLIDAARRKDFLVIGVDSDQSIIAPGRIAASMVKRLDNAVLKAFDLVSSNTFKGGIWTLGLRDHGIEFKYSRFNRSLFTPEILSKLDEIKNFLLTTPYP